MPPDVTQLRDALLASSELGLIRTGIVTAISKGAVPWTVTVRFVDGTTLGMPAAGWYEPTVNDVVLVLRQDAAAVCLGGFAGASKTIVTTATVYTPPAPATPPAPPTLPATVRTAYVASDATKTWDGSAWRTDDKLIQTGATAQRGFVFYGSKIATAKGAGTIVGASIYLQRELSDHGVAGRANVRLGTHSNGTQPGAGSTALSNVQTFTAALDRGGDATLQLSAAQIAALNAGTAVGFGLEPGTVGIGSADFVIAYGKTEQPAIGQLALTISG